MKFGDLVFTEPNRYDLKDGPGLVSFVIHKLTRGPTHVMFALNKNKVMHMEYPYGLRIETLKQAMRLRKGYKVEVVRPKYSFIQFLKLKWAVSRVKGKEFAYATKRLPKLLFASLFPKYRTKHQRTNTHVCSTFVADLLTRVGFRIKHKDWLSPMELFMMFK